MQNGSTDIELWNDLKNGEINAFELLFRRYYSLLYQYGARICNDAEMTKDCIQDLFIEIWQSKSTPELRSVRAYLLKALKYKIYKAARQSNDTVSFDGKEELDFDLSHENILIIRADESKRNASIARALEQLPNRQKEIIYLKIQQGLSYEELSEVMHLNYQVCRNLFSQAIKALRKILATMSNNQ